jgi:tRNA G18 (ribose-2'-O)-methylase SpoU
MSDRATVGQLAGPEEIERALQRGDPVRLLLYLPEARDPRVARLVERARAAGIRTRSASQGVLWRLSRVRPHGDVLALIGQRPEATLDGIFGGGGSVWLLVGVTYPGNAGFAIRTAEVSGANGIVVDAEFDHTARRQSVRASMRADWYMPVVWAGWQETLAHAQSAGFRVIGIEDVGRVAPWDLDLTGPVLFVVGAEETGIPPELLDLCDETVRIPMGGFIRSYNLQVAVAVVSVERLRQLGSGSGSG